MYREKKTGARCGIIPLILETILFLENNIAPYFMTIDIETKRRAHKNMKDLYYNSLNMARIISFVTVY